MNKDMLQGRWHEIKGMVKNQWGKLTDQDIMEINGQREKLVGKLEAKYGYTKQQAEQQVNQFNDQLNNNSGGLFS